MKNSKKKTLKRLDIVIDNLNAMLRECESAGIPYIKLEIGNMPIFVSTSDIVKVKL